MSLNEIVGYLPHKLKCKLKVNSIQDIVEIIGFKMKKYGKFNQTILFSCTKHISYRHIDYFYPILHPLSDLAKPITVDGYNTGEQFVPMKMIKDKLLMDWCDMYDEAIEHIIEAQEWDYVIALPYQFIQLLYRWHFDIHGLIGKGEAIDINTLEEK